MNTTDLIRRLHEHRLWVNDLLWASARSLTSNQLHQSFSIGQGSVWQSLIHLYVAEFVWLAALEGNSAPKLPSELLGEPLGSRLGEVSGDAWQDFAVLRAALDERWQELLAGLSEASLSDIVYKTNPGGQANVALGTTRSDVLLHVCTHAHYTVAQVVNMLRQLGVQPLPDPMLITLARQQTSAPARKIV